MKVFLTNQESNLRGLLPQFKALPLSYDADTVLQEKESSVVIPGGAAVADLTSHDFSSFFQYDIFPRRIMAFAGEWQGEGRPMREGDVIVQQAFLPPLPISVKLVFAVRVLKIVREPTKVGFSYGTLKGHPEMGHSEFYFAIRDGTVRAAIHTHSHPGTLLTRAVAPIMTLPYQQYCTNLGLQRMRESVLASVRSRA
jgi:hypothetical protein